jgi:hypothetical protein
VSSDEIFVYSRVPALTIHGFVQSRRLVRLKQIKQFLSISLHMAFVKDTVKCSVRFGGLDMKVN